GQRAAAGRVRHTAPPSPACSASEHPAPSSEKLSAQNWPSPPPSDGKEGLPGELPGPSTAQPSAAGLLSGHVSRSTSRQGQSGAPRQAAGIGAQRSLQQSQSG